MSCTLSCYRAAEGGGNHSVFRALSLPLSLARSMSQEPSAERPAGLCPGPAVAGLQGPPDSERGASDPPTQFWSLTAGVSLCRQVPQGSCRVGQGGHEARAWGQLGHPYTKWPHPHRLPGPRGQDPCMEVWFTEQLRREDTLTVPAAHRREATQSAGHAGPPEGSLWRERIL